MTGAVKHGSFEMSTLHYVRASLNDLSPTAKAMYEALNEAAAKDIAKRDNPKGSEAIINLAEVQELNESTAKLSGLSEDQAGELRALLDSGASANQIEQRINFSASLLLCFPIFPTSLLPCFSGSQPRKSKKN